MWQTNASIMATVLQLALVDEGLASCWVHVGDYLTLKDEPESYSLWDLSAEYTVDPADFASKGKATPFEGKRVFGRCLLTVKNGKAVYIAPEIKS